MATATATTTDAALAPADVIRRHVKRTLPVDLTDEEMLDIARDAAKKRRMLKQLEADLDAEKKKRNQQIAELQREIDTHDRELDTEQQERVVLCDEIFRAGTVYTRRSDTLEEFEPRPATAQEAQRYLPAVESTLHTLPPSAPLLDQALAAQGAAPANDATPAGEGGAGEAEAGADDGVDEDDDDAPEDDGLSELTPAQKAVREAEQGRAKRRKAGAKSGGKGKAKP